MVGNPLALQSQRGAEFRRRWPDPALHCTWDPSSTSAPMGAMATQKCSMGKPNQNNIAPIWCRKQHRCHHFSKLLCISATPVLKPTGLFCHCERRLGEITMFRLKAAAGPSPTDSSYTEMHHSCHTPVDIVLSRLTSS